MNTFLSMPTRSAARVSNNNLKSSGKVCTIVDKGISFKGNARWGVLVAATVAPKSTRKVVKMSRPNIRIGFDIRPVMSGIVAYDLYLDGEFILRRDTKLDVYEQAVKLAVKTKIDYSTLKYKN